MPAKKTPTERPSGILLYAKRPGLTSFSSLWGIKRALGTRKLGHTGTLDAFAEGLLVVLAGSLTRLVPHVTGLQKRYQAVICFGSETDTLDPTGTVCKTATAPCRAQVEAACAAFCGALSQVPPLYSAVHSGGERASDRVRAGKPVVLEARPIFIYENRLLDFREADSEDRHAYALVEISCSKGTYIRALARDMAAFCGSCAHLTALRRTQVGPFLLADAVGFDALPEFTLARCRGETDMHSVATFEDDGDAIRARLMSFDPGCAAACGFSISYVLPAAEAAFVNGRPVQDGLFQKPVDRATVHGAAFYTDGAFAGMLHCTADSVRYGFVLPSDARSVHGMKILSWEQLLRGSFPAAWKEQGTAVTIGSFDGMHGGHQALVDAVVAQHAFVPGIVTFRHPVKAGREAFPGAVSSMAYKLALAARRGVRFAVVIDFSPEFSKMEGNLFIDALQKACGVRYMAEGFDFRCGYRGALSMTALADVARNLSFVLDSVPDVLCDGERISSSRVRQAVMRGRLGLAERLLRHPFCLDCSGMEWRYDGAEAGTARLRTQRTLSAQILPPPGRYDVALLCGIGGRDRISATCVLETDGMEVCVSSDVRPGFIQAVEWIGTADGTIESVY